MKLRVFVLFLGMIPASFACAEPDLSGFPISNASDVLKLLKRDGFGDVKLASIMSDIKKNKVYRFGKKYGICEVNVESDYDPKHFGGIDFSCSKDDPHFDVTNDMVKRHLESLGEVKELEYSGMKSYHWVDHEFKCSVDISEKDHLFQYLCHYIE